MYLNVHCAFGKINIDQNIANYKSHFSRMHYFDPQPKISKKLLHLNITVIWTRIMQV